MMRAACRGRAVPGEHPSIERAGLRLRFAREGIIERFAKSLVRLDRLPTPSANHEQLDQQAVQMLVEGAAGRERVDFSGKWPKSSALSGR